MVERFRPGTVARYRPPPKPAPRGPLKPVYRNQRFSTGLIEWVWVAEDTAAYFKWQIVEVGRPPVGPAYVIRFLGESKDTLYLFRSMRDTDSAYMDCRPAKRKAELYDIAEAHAKEDQLRPPDPIYAPSPKNPTPAAREAVQKFKSSDLF